MRNLELDRQVSLPTPFSVSGTYGVNLDARQARVAVAFATKNGLWSDRPVAASFRTHIDHIIAVRAGRQMLSPDTVANVANVHDFVFGRKSLAVQVQPREAVRSHKPPFKDENTVAVGGGGNPQPASVRLANLTPKPVHDRCVADFYNTVKNVCFHAAVMVTAANWKGGNV